MPRRAGPELYRRYLTDRALWEGSQWWPLYWCEGLSYRAIATIVGRPLTTVWRHINLFHDYSLPTNWGNPPPRRPPPMRGTAACPRGRPHVPGHDGPTDRPRELAIPAQRCTARRRDGQPCGRWARRGAPVCPSHGGSAPQVIAAARRRVAELRADDELLVTVMTDREVLLHNAVLKQAAAERLLFHSPALRRRERAETRRRRLADPA